jgi:hypothetical protein
MDLTPEYWRERAERVRKAVAFVDEATQETLLRIAGNYESLARQAKNSAGAKQTK